MFWDWLVGIAWSAVVGIATVVTCVVAVLTLLAAGRDSRERTRPVVVAEYRVAVTAFRSLTLVVRNTGASTARDVDVRFTPPLKDGNSEQKMREFIAERYRNRIPTIGPAQELTNAVHYNADSPEESDLPHQLTIDVSYRGNGRKRYSDKFQLDAAVYKNHTYSTSTGSVEGRLKTISESLEKTQASVRKIAQKLH